MERTRILAVEGKTKIGLQLKSFLEEWGYQVEWVWDAGEAIEVLEGKVPDVVITDVDLPGFDGPFLTRLIKAHPDYQGVPVIAIGATTPEMEQAAVEAGCIACFSAPLDQERLLALIRDVAPVPVLSASA